MFFSFRTMTTWSWKGPGPCTYPLLETTRLKCIASEVIFLHEHLPWEQYTFPISRIMHGTGLSCCDFEPMIRRRKRRENKVWVTHHVWTIVLNSRHYHVPHSLESWAQSLKQIRAAYPSLFCVSPVPVAVQRLVPAWWKREHTREGWG
jgi:hypothetical protein